jgi:hypothetical protein
MVRPYPAADDFPVEDRHLLKVRSDRRLSDFDFCGVMCTQRSAHEGRLVSDPHRHDVRTYRDLESQSGRNGLYIGGNADCEVGILATLTAHRTHQSIEHCYTNLLHHTTERNELETLMYLARKDFRQTLVPRRRLELPRPCDR